MLYIAKSLVKITHCGDHGVYDSYYLEHASEGEIRSIKDALEDDFQEMGPRGLAEYLQYGEEERKKLDHVVKSIVVNIDNNKAKAIIETTRELTSDEIEVLKEYLLGQYADGWGEGFEQREIDTYQDINEEEAYDEENDEYYTEEVEERIDVYAHFWQPDEGFKVDIVKVN